MITMHIPQRRHKTTEKRIRDKDALKAKPMLQAIKANLCGYCHLSIVYALYLTCRKTKQKLADKKPGPPK